LEYADTGVTVCCGRMLLKLHGADLRLTAMNPRGLVISGTLTGVEFDTI
jgi:hypothetical protein